MFGFVKKLFINKSSDVENNDDKYDKKRKFVTVESDEDSGFFIHKIPKSTHKENRMPSYMEAHDNINTQQFEVIDQKTGKVTMIDSSNAHAHMEQIPPGINIPGIGPVGGVQQQRQQQQQQRQQQQHPNNQQRQGQQQQYNQQQRQPQPQYSNQQNYAQPQNQQYVDDGYNNVGNGQLSYAGPVNETVIAPKAQAPYPYSEMAATDDAYHLWIDLPGVKKENIRVSYGNSALTISGSRESNLDILRITLLDGEPLKPKGKNDPILNESSTVPQFLMSEFSFVYPFKKLIDETAITPKFTDGVLYVRMQHRIIGDEVVIAIM